MITKDNVRLPVRSTKNSAGYDFYAPCDIALSPKKWVTVNTCVKLDGSEKIYAPAPGRGGKTVYHRWFMMLAPRSSMAMNYGLRVANIPPIIDQDYVNENDWIKVKITSDVPYIIPKGTRFMQGIFIPYGILENEETPTKERKGGIGSTGE